MNRQEIMTKYRLSSELYDEMEAWVRDKHEDVCTSDDPIERDIRTDGAHESFEEEFRSKAPHLHYGEFSQVYSWMY